MANGQLRVDKMFAFLAIDPDDGTEGVVSAQLGSVHMPLMGADLEMVEKLTPLAEQIAAQSGARITVAEFSTRTDLDTITAGKA